MPGIDRWENEGGSPPPSASPTRLRAARRQLGRLERLIATEQGRPLPSPAELRRLRQEAQFLKDEIDRLLAGR